MLVAIVDKATEYQDKLRELKKYSSAELFELIFPLIATTNMMVKYNKTMLKSIINYILSPFPRGLSGVVFGTRPKALGNDIVLIFGKTNFAKISHSFLCG